jgi:arsenite methyltransferase
MMSNHKWSDDDLRTAVRENYAKAARNVLESGEGACCGTDCGCTGDAFAQSLYSEEETRDLPKDAVGASLGCANPVALAGLRPGETVLDLGSGGGIDVLMSARRVGPTGFAYGLDMTDEMLALAEKNRRESGLDNVKFLKGTIEEIPLEDQSVDVVISNCVVNLSPDKARTLREAYRVLRPGGRLAIADIVADADLPNDVRENLEAYAGCVAGALTFEEYRRLLADAGFEEVSLESVRTFGLGGDGSSCCGSETEGEASGPRLHSVHVRAVKPGSLG